MANLLFFTTLGGGHSEQSSVHEQNFSPEADTLGYSFGHIFKLQQCLGMFLAPF